MKKIILFITTLIITISVNAQQECISCIDNTINYDKYASAIGKENTVWGFCSLAVGEGNNLKGDYAVAMGKQNYSDGIASFAMGFGCKSSGDYSVAMGKNSKTFSDYSFAMGNEAIAKGSGAVALGFVVEANATKSFAAGQFIKSNANNTITLGRGTTSQTGLVYLENNLSNTLMVGFNSNIPSFFIGSSSGMETTGKIGIGNVTDPQAKLHIKADANENTTLFLESSNWENKYALIQLGTPQNSIKAEKNIGLSFFTEKDYLFNGGNVGIGLDNPGEKLEVDGNISAIAYFGDGSNLDGTGDNLGNHIMSQNLLTAGHWINSDTDPDQGIYIDGGGRVGIGTSQTNENMLAVAGEITATYFHGNGSQLTDIEGINLGNHIMTQNLLTAGHWINSDTDLNQGIFIDGGGRVGIGTSQTNENMLAVAGDITATYFHGNGSQLTGIEGDNLGNHIMTQNLLTNGHWINSDTDEDQGIFIDVGGNVGIGTEQTDDYTLAVAGNIRANEVMIMHLDDWYDCVFEDDYELPSLADIEVYVKQNKHLPGIPSEEEVMQEGINLGEMNAILLKKVEELTLHLIKQQKEIDALKKGM